eukprot:239592-Pyramimonas_sp.AAC.2
MHEHTDGLLRFSRLIVISPLDIAISRVRRISGVLRYRGVGWAGTARMSAADVMGVRWLEDGLPFILLLVSYLPTILWVSRERARANS